MKTICIVDDEPKICELLKEILQEAGYKTLVCHNGLEALECLHTFRADLLVLDLHMPGMDGFTVLTELERLDISVPTIVLSAWTLQDEEKDFLAKRVAQVVDKPVEVERLVNTVQNIFIAFASNLENIV